MDKRLITNIIILFFSCIGFSQQIKSGKIVYNLDMDLFYDRIAESNKKDPRPSTKLYEQAANEMRNFYFELNFNTKEASFVRQKSLNPDNNLYAYNLAKVLCGNNKYYTDLKKDRLLMLTYMNNSDYHVSSSIRDINWQVTQETKKIGDYKCIKAVWMKPVSKKKTIPIVAWYTPEIPFRYGPNEYSGTLPGMILQLDDTTITYKCSSIKFYKQDKKIDWPRTTTTITIHEYNSINSEIIQRLRN